MCKSVSRTSTTVQYCCKFDLTTMVMVRTKEVPRVVDCKQKREYAASYYTNN